MFYVHISRSSSSVFCCISEQQWKPQQPRAAHTWRGNASFLTSVFTPGGTLWWILSSLRLRQVSFGPLWVVCPGLELNCRDGAWTGLRRHVLGAVFPHSPAPQNAKGPHKKLDFPWLKAAQVSPLVLEILEYPGIRLGGVWWNLRNSGNIAGFYPWPRETQPPAFYL